MPHNGSRLPGKFAAALETLLTVRQQDLDAALDNAEVVLLLLDHTAFKAVDKGRLRSKALIDTKGLCA